MLRRLQAQLRPKSKTDTCDEQTARIPRTIIGVRKNQRLWLPGADRSDWAILGRFRTLPPRVAAITTRWLW